MNLRNHFYMKACFHPYHQVGANSTNPTTVTPDNNNNRGCGDYIKFYQLVAVICFESAGTETNF